MNDYFINRKCLQLHRLIVLLIVFYFLPVEMFAQTKPAIQLNQAGYYPKATKLAFVTGEVEAGPFYVVSTKGNDTAFRGTLGAQKQSARSSTKTRMADFSSLKKAGNYFLFVKGVGQSYSFSINDNIHHDVAVATLKGFYFIRSDFPLSEKYAGKWARPAGHHDTEVYIHPSAASEKRASGTTISTPGGWYDAGDYNKYMVNSGITMGTLLSAYENFETYFKALQTNIPESSDNIPDILNEIVYNLRWMLTMQDPDDGGVYHKCTNASFDGMVMPGITNAPRYVVQKGTAATLDFAAVAAQSARILKRYEKDLPGLSDSCLKAAVNAWQWAVKNPKLLYEQNNINKTFDPDITTGAYGDRQISDEWMWAAAELFVTTKKQGYFDTVLSRMKDPVTLPSWSNVAMLGYYSLISNATDLPSKTGTRVNQMRDSVIRMADEYTANSTRSAFATVMGQSEKDFIWGSSAVAANQGILLVNAYLLTKNKKYWEGALSNLDYLLGRNATGYSFVTGTGTKYPMHPHHRPSEADGIDEPVPGLLSGGPNPGRQDKCRYEFTEPETAFTDQSCSYASNEIAINWNAPIVYLANAIEALHAKNIMNK